MNREQRAKLIAECRYEIDREGGTFNEFGCYAASKWETLLTGP